MIAKRQGSHWGLCAAACAAIAGWRIYEMVSATVVNSGDSDTVGLLIVGGALTGLIASLLKLSTES
ncbi:MAG: hypothetical protein E7774_14550 [Bradyrhizobium sp.]|nr:MAG: hypothetical protein E7774_14550 [Bradyrhizobium sp.]